MIRAGAMRTDITVQTPGTPGPLGQVQWVTFAVTRAEVKTTTGRELSAPQIGGADVTHEMVTRYLAGAKANMRATFAGRVFDIMYVVTETEGRPRQTHLFCREVMTV